MLKYFSREYWGLTPSQRDELSKTSSATVSYVLRSLSRVRQTAADDRDRKMKSAEVLREHQVISNMDFLNAQVDFGETEATVEIAKAKIQNLVGNLSKYELHKLIISKTTELGSVTQALMYLENDKNFGYLSYDEYELRKIELDQTKTQNEKELEKLEYKLGKGLLTETEYRKEKATLNREPFIAVESSFDPTKGIHGLTFSFVWNDFWVKTMHEAGYRGKSEEMMDSWFLDICRSAVLVDSLNDNTPREIVPSVVTDGNTKYIS